MKKRVKDGSSKSIWSKRMDKYTDNLDYISTGIIGF